MCVHSRRRYYTPETRHHILPYFHGSCLVELKLRLYRACTLVRESPTRIRPTVPQKLHGSADCLRLADVLRFVVWAGILSTSNPARKTATVLPARLVAEGEVLEAIGRSTEKAGLI